MVYARTHTAVRLTHTHIKIFYCLHTLSSRLSMVYKHCKGHLCTRKHTYPKIVYNSGTLKLQHSKNYLYARDWAILAHSKYSIPRITCTHETEQFWHTQSTAFQKLPVRTRLSNSGTLKVQHSKITCTHETEQFWHIQSTAFQELPVSKDWATLAHSNYSIPRITCKHETEQFRHTQITEFQKLPVRTRLSNSGTLKIQHSKNYLYARDWAAAMFFWCSVSELLQYMPIRMNSISCSVLQAKVWEDRQRASPGS